MRAVTPYEALCLRMGAKAFLRLDHAGINAIEQDRARGRNFTWGSTGIGPYRAPGGLRAALGTSTNRAGTSTVLDVAGISTYSIGMWVLRNASWSQDQVNAAVGWFVSGGWFGFASRSTSDTFYVSHGHTGALYQVRVSASTVPLNRWSFLGGSGTITSSFPDVWMNGVLDNGTGTNGSGSTGTTPAGVTTWLDKMQSHPAYGLVVFDRILTANEWARLYAAGRAQGLR